MWGVGPLGTLKVITGGHSKATKQSQTKDKKIGLAISFTCTRVGNEVRPQSAVSLKILASESIKPNELRFHLQTTLPAAEKHLEPLVDKNNNFNTDICFFFEKSQKGLCIVTTTGRNFNSTTKVSYHNKQHITELKTMYSTFNSGLELKILLLSTHTTQYA